MFPDSYALQSANHTIKDRSSYRHIPHLRFCVSYATSIDQALKEADVSLFDLGRMLQRELTNLLWSK